MTTAPAPVRRPGVKLWRERLRRHQVRTWLLYLPLCTMSSSLALGAFEYRRGGYVEGVMSNLAVGVWLVAMAAAVSLAWRRRLPELVVLWAALVTLVLPIDPVAALIAFGSLMVRRLDRVTAALGVLVTAATGAATWRDSRGTTIDSSFWQFLRSNDKSATFAPLPWWVVALITVALVGVVAGMALLLRSRSSLTQVQLVVEEQRAAVDHLSDEVGRQAERERIAQEVHDALGHRLSLLSLHAGALEVTSEDNPRVAESAALVRANAQQSMADLRSLLAMLRQPDSPDVAAAVPSLDDVPALIDETVATGVNIVSTVQLEALARLDDTTSRSAFRIVQELLTNARRHAPGIGVRVAIRATPELGVEIVVGNHLPSHVPVDFRPGSGLDGIRNRVTALGGDFRCFVDGQRVFRVAVRLPWLWAAELGPVWTPGEGVTGGAVS
ncbi:histidine kinase [Knoellia locipacati]|uniref:histidine kinase n=1 Tax=Knoellia locipacati TaxID=882824 RepID=A0A512T4V6_9MICO|nr:histidine kinase [Knoellia locipacati]GEQ15212.1 sensor histidine kinase [Knoellia locipacati]